MPAADRLANMLSAPGRTRLPRLLAAATLLVAATGVALHHTLRAAQPSATRNADWAVYGGGKAGQRYSPLTQINRSNVQRLRPAWTWDTGETGGLQTHPLMIGRTLFAYTPSQVVVALDAVTGRERWRFDSGIHSGQPDRGLAYWTDGVRKVLFADTLYAVWALDPATGKPIETFGTKGSIDLRVGDDGKTTSGIVALTTPGTVYKDLLIMGLRTAEAKPAVRGDIRAYDVHTGALRWSFHTIPRPGEPGYETWPKDAWQTTGGANNWSGSVVDEQRGILYVPTGSAVDDFYGGDRAGNDLYANCLLAIDAATGKLLWHFQAVHHDIWDRDFPAPPILLTVRHDGKAVDAVAQTTKHGQVFVFDRVTGKPLFPIEEKGFPASKVPGEWTSATQPMTSTPTPYARQRLTADMLTQRTPEAHAWAQQQFATFTSDGQFIPLSVGKQTVFMPGFDGGAEWGGDAVDPTTGTLYINSNDVAWTGGLEEVKPGMGAGAAAYSQNCAGCHGDDRRGQANVFPSLIVATDHLSEQGMAEVVHNGRGRMPGFPNLTGDTLHALLTYVRTGSEPAGAPNGGRTDKQELAASMPEYTAKYRFTGYRKFLDTDGYPAVAPPWGTLNAIDLNTGKYRWKIPLGEYPELVAKGLKDTGSENYGGPVVTAGGLLFIGATNYDGKLRAFNKDTGKLLWEYSMGAAGNATPATYMVDGKQYVVIAVSNAHNPKAPQGAKYMAFALP